MVATGNGQEKKIQGWGNVSELYFESGKIEILKKKSGTIEIIIL